MSTAQVQADFRQAKTMTVAPRAIADVHRGMILAVADVPASPQDVFRALTSEQVLEWWHYPGIYHQKNWKADLSPRGKWSVTVELDAGGEVDAWGEFCELELPSKIVMTRRFSGHPFLGDRETTITYNLASVEGGTRVTVYDEGFLGRREALLGNAEIWEKVLGWLSDWFARKSSNGDVS